MINHIPGAVDVRITKAVAIVPFFCLSQMIFQVISFQELFYFLFGEAELLIESGISDRKNFKIIQPGKNAFLRDTQTSGQGSKLQKLIRFQCTSE